MKDRTLKVLLAVVAVGLWANVARPWLTPTPAQAQVSAVKAVGGAAVGDVTPIQMKPGGAPVKKMAVPGETMPYVTTSADGKTMVAYGDKQKVVALLPIPAGEEFLLVSNGKISLCRIAYPSSDKREIEIESTKPLP